MKPLTRFAALAVALAAAAAGTFAASCATVPDENRFTAVLAGDNSLAEFAGSDTQVGVRVFIEKRCGTLDCHGQVGRPFIVFHQRGLRLLTDAGGQVSGGSLPTTQAEILATYDSIVSLEPEVLSQVAQDPQNNPVERLLMVKKPLGIERHKGGTVLAPGDPGDICLRSWFFGQADKAACEAAAAVP
jgi:hypothetical protein